MAFGPLCAALGGSLFNPALNAALYVVGGHGGAVHHALRAASQVAGALLGARAAFAALPHVRANRGAFAPGPPPGVSTLEAAACELLCSAALHFVVLFSIRASSQRLAFWAPLVVTVALVCGGSRSGPIMNPGVAFGWHALLGRQTPGEHALVYCAAPLAGAVAAAAAFSALQGSLPGLLPPPRRRGRPAKASAVAPAPTPATPRRAAGKSPARSPAAPLPATPARDDAKTPAAAAFTVRVPTPAARGATATPRRGAATPKGRSVTPARAGRGRSQG